MLGIILEKALFIILIPVIQRRQSGDSFKNLPKSFQI
jgi:hypothetical protein